MFHFNKNLWDYSYKIILDPLIFIVFETLLSLVQNFDQFLYVIFLEDDIFHNLIFVHK